MIDSSDAASIQTVPDLHLTALGPTVELSPGLRGMRLPLPFALDHVNLWLLRDGAGWTLIDTGIDDDATKTYWSERLEETLDGRPLTRLIATHFHPDHMGLAGWLCARTGAELWTTRTEWLTAQALVRDTSDGFVDAGRRFDHAAGLEPALIDQRSRRGNLYRARAGAPSATYRRIREDDDLMIDGEVLTLWPERLEILPGALEVLV